MPVWITRSQQPLDCLYQVAGCAVAMLLGSAWLSLADAPLKVRLKAQPEALYKLLVYNMAEFPTKQVN